MQEHWIRTHNHDGENSAEIEVPPAPSPDPVGSEVEIVNVTGEIGTYNIHIPAFGEINRALISLLKITCSYNAGTFGGMSAFIGIGDLSSSNNRISLFTIIPGETKTVYLYLPFGPYRIITSSASSSNSNLNVKYKLFKLPGLEY
jgi:hypothetical protein